jgi:hypothetical protein
MSDIRSKISEKSPYYISKHRYLELRHFCMQYDEWKQQLEKLSWYGQAGDGISSGIGKPVEKMTEKRGSYLRRIEMVEQSCIEADSDIYKWILISVTDGVPYSGLRAHGIPCSRDYFYDRYRKFFWCLDRNRE